MIGGFRDNYLRNEMSDSIEGDGLEISHSFPSAALREIVSGYKIVLRDHYTEYHCDKFAWSPIKEGECPVKYKCF